MIRLTFLLRCKPGMTLPEFQEYWRRKHGPLVAGFGDALQARRYVQVHTLDDPMNIDFKRSSMWLAKEDVFIDHTQGD